MGCIISNHIDFKTRSIIISDVIESKNFLTHVYETYRLYFKFGARSSKKLFFSIILLKINLVYY